MSIYEFHEPVLLENVQLLLDCKDNDLVVDGTVGFGGHASVLLSGLSDKGHLIGIDQDEDALSYCRSKFSLDPRVTLVKGNYSNIRSIIHKCGYDRIDKCLIDCGISSFQLDRTERGFSFLNDNALDMRMDALDNPLTAAELLNTYSKDDLLRLFREFGELRSCEKFVDELISFRENHVFRIAPDLVQCIKKGFYFRNKRQVYMRICAQVFQACRIEVNQELKHLELFLSDIIECLSPGGRCALISFHSLEDRVIKTFIRSQKDRIVPINKNVVQLSYKEAKKNTRAKSAKLRVFEKV